MQLVVQVAVTDAPQDSQLDLSVLDAHSWAAQTRQPDGSRRIASAVQVSEVDEERGGQMLHLLELTLAALQDLEDLPPDVIRQRITAAIAALTPESRTGESP